MKFSRRNITKYVVANEELYFRQCIFFIYKDITKFIIGVFPIHIFFFMKKIVIFYTMVCETLSIQYIVCSVKKIVALYSNKRLSLEL